MMKKPRFRTVVLILTGSLVVGLCAFGSERGGLFNNRADDARALQDHNAAWREWRFGNRMSRLQMEMIVRMHDGSCITSDAEWEWVDMRQRLDQYLAPERKRIECRFPVKRLRLLWIPVRYMWTIELEPLSRNELRVLQVRRTRDPLSF